MNGLPTISRNNATTKPPCKWTDEELVAYRLELLQAVADFNRLITDPKMPRSMCDCAPEFQQQLVHELNWAMIHGGAGAGAVALAAEDKEDAMRQLKSVLSNSKEMVKRMDRSAEKHLVKFSQMH